MTDTQVSLIELVKQAQAAVILRDKQIHWLCKKLEDVERTLRPENTDACWHYNWREASYKYAKEQLEMMEKYQWKKRKKNKNSTKCGNALFAALEK